MKAPNSVNAFCENIKIKFITMIKKDEYMYSWPILLCDRVNETNRWTKADEAKENRQAPTHRLKFHEEVVIASEARTAVMQPPQLNSEAQTSVTSQA